jgi:dihydrolipoamide dehydrogenase
MQHLHADKIIIATGSRPAELPALPLDGNRIISSNEAVNLSRIPASVLIVGAGVIGCEFAGIFNEFGSMVTLIEAMPRALMTEDEEIALILERELKKKKIKLITNTRIDHTTHTASGVDVALADGTHLSAEMLLVSIGRALNTEGLGLEEVGIARGSKGEIIVNNHMETNVPGIYAVGDVVGGTLLAHVAAKEGVTAACSACGIPSSIDYSVIPAAVFTTPEIGSVGLREHQVQQSNIPYHVGRFPIRNLGKAHAMGELPGLIKIIAHKETGHILGVHIIGPHASDLIHEGALAIHAKLSIDKLASMIHAHPTLAEGIMEAAEDCLGSAIHLPKKFV